MKHWVLGFLAVGAVSIVACGSDDSGDGNGNTGGGTGGGVIGGAGGTGGIVTGGSGGVATGGTGASSTGGTGGGGPDCTNQFPGATCMQIGTNIPAQDACLHGECCDEMDACLADDQCGSFLSCGSACSQAGGDPQSCGAECQACVTNTTSPGIITAFNSCMQTCLASDGGTGGSPGDGGTTDAASD